VAATKGRFASDGEHRLYSALVKVYGPHSVQGHVGMEDVVASEGIRLSDAELRYLRLAHFDFVIWDAEERAVCAWEFDGEHHVTQGWAPAVPRLGQALAARHSAHGKGTGQRPNITSNQAPCGCPGGRAG